MMAKECTELGTKPVCKYEYWFAGIPSLSGKKKIRLKSQFPDPEEFYRLPIGHIQQIPWLTEREKKAVAAAKGTPEHKLDAQACYCAEKGIKLAIWQDPGYPKRLRDIYSPPYGLFYRGSLPPEDAPAVAIVGARGCSHYGKQMARAIGCGLASQGVSVISGMALGIDGAGHQGALQAGGRTYGVFGCGVDVCYPAAHRELYGAIPKMGGLLSEYQPRSKPLAMFFPQRNRIISGLSDAVIVVEAREKSGALITADFALEQGREVYAVPGRAGDPSSQGTNRLIQQGAGIFLSVGDFLKEMGIFADFVEDSAGNQKFSLEKSERLVYSCVDLSPKSLDGLLAETSLPLGEMIEILESLREKGCILEVYKNYYIRPEPSGFA